MDTSKDNIFIGETNMAENNSRINDNNYYVINGWMINRLRLKGVTLSAYAIIYGFSQDGENEFTGSLQYLCDFCGGVSKPTIIKALKELTESGLIIRREERINNILFTRYKINQNAICDFLYGSKEILPPVKNLNGDSKEILSGDGKNSLSGSKEILPNNKNININRNKEKENIIIDYLNLKAGTRFKASSKATQQHINARLDEGFDVEDFKIVIDKKCAEWLGTDFAQYLRPVTLFGTKFEAYLNAPIYQRKTYGQSGVEVKQPEQDDLAGIL